jgi:hypothetical protein
MKTSSLSKKVARISAGLLILSLALVMGAAASPLEVDAESGLCKAAFSRCMGEAIFSGLLSSGATLFYYVSFCLIGWDFCQKYVEG